MMTDSTTYFDYLYHTMRRKVMSTGRYGIFLPRTHCGGLSKFHFWHVIPPFQIGIYMLQLFCGRMPIIIPKGANP